jgi:hypothetical protein
VLVSAFQTVWDNTINATATTTINKMIPIQQMHFVDGSWHLSPFWRLLFPAAISDADSLVTESILVIRWR